MPGYWPNRVWPQSFDAQVCETCVSDVNIVVAQECGVQSPFPLLLASTAPGAADTQPSPHQTAATLAAVQGLQLHMQLQHVLTAVVPEVSQR